MPEYNGVYRRVGQELHGGFPRYEHASSGVHLYRYQAYEKWFVRADFTPDIDRNMGSIVSNAGEVPTGRQTWTCADGKLGWVDSAVTVRELVRAPIYT